MDADLLALALSLIVMSVRWRFHVLRESIANLRDNVKRSIVQRIGGSLLLRKALGKIRDEGKNAVSQDRLMVKFSQNSATVIDPAKSAHASDIPIVFIHGSNSLYLPYSLAQARASNPGSEIFLLGDPDNDRYNFLEHRNFRDYFMGASEFAKIYRHYNTTGLHYELFNFQRWFILKEFLQSNKFNQCLYLDSDVMLYASAGEEAKKFDLVDFTLADRMSPCVFFLRRREALDDYCEFLMRVYRKADRFHYDKMLLHFAARQRNSLNGGVCDMTTFEMFAEEHSGEVGEVTQMIDDSVYDPNINSPHPGFEMANGIKKIVWKDNLPYGRHLKGGLEIRFKSLHFQGIAKSLMSQYCTVNRETCCCN